MRRLAHEFHPWRRLRDLGPTWKLEWSDDLPGDAYGKTNFWARTITLRNGMSFEERRCTITHELEHIRRGPASCCAVLKEEAVVDQASARLLLPSVVEVADSLMFCRGDYEETAEDLWVDIWTLEVRLGTLYDLERRYIRKRMADAVLVVTDE